MTRSAQWIENNQERSPELRSRGRLSTIRFLLRYPIFLLVFGPPVLRPRDAFAGADTSQSHFDAWSIVQVAWLFAIALRAIYRLGFAERFIVPRPVRSILKYSLFLGLLFTASITYSPGPAISAEFSVLYFLALICAVEFVVDANQHPPNWLQCIFVVRLTMMILLAMVILCLAFDPTMVMNTVEGAGIRLLGGAVAPITAVGPIIAIISAYCFLNSLGSRFRSVVYFIIGMTATLVTQSRGAEIELFLFLAIVGIGWAKMKKHSAYLFVSVLTAVMIIGGVALLITGADTIWKHFNRGQDTSSFLTASGRTDVWGFVIGYTVSHPQGMGYVSGMRSTHRISSATDMHALLSNNGGTDNSYIEVLADAGWLALAVYLIMLIKTFGLGWHAETRERLARLSYISEARHTLRCALLLLAFCAVQGLEGSDYVTPLRHDFYFQNVFIAIILGVSASLITSSRTDVPISRRKNADIPSHAGWPLTKVL